MNTHTLFTGFAIILLIQFISTWLLATFAISFPPALLGMIILTILLLTNYIKIEWVEATCTVLIEKMGMLFVPAGVGMLLYLDIIAKEWLPLFATIFITSIVIMVATGLFIETLLKKKGGAHK